MEMEAEGTAIKLKRKKKGKRRKKRIRRKMGNKIKKEAGNSLFFVELAGPLYDHFLGLLNPLKNMKNIS
jgi:hypothetical protein